MATGKTFCVRTCTTLGPRARVSASKVPKSNGLGPAKQGEDVGRGRPPGSSRKSGGISEPAVCVRVVDACSRALTIA
jgi:hypothetical protein